MSNPSITFLGTGEATTLQYFQSSFIIQENQSKLLVDTGSGLNIVSQLKKVDIGLTDIQHIFLTHRHLDHFTGLLWILRLRGGRIARHSDPDLTIYCSQHNKDMIKHIGPLFLKKAVVDLFDDKIHFVTLDKKEHIALYTWDMQPFDCLSKKEELYGFVLKTSDGVSLTCLGDEPYKAELEKYCRGVDYLLHEAFCLESDKEIFNPHTINHSTVIDAAQNARDLQVKNLIIYHTEEKETYGERKKRYTHEAKTVFSGQVFIPDDLETIALQ